MLEVDAGSLSKQNVNKNYAHWFSGLRLGVEQLENRAPCNRPGDLLFDQNGLPKFASRGGCVAISVEK